MSTIKSRIFGVLHHRQVLVVLVLVSLLIFFSSAWYLSVVKSRVIARFEYPTDVTITDNSNSIGIGVRKNELHFGVMHAGREARSGVIATNMGSVPVRALIYPQTNFSDWLVFSETDFILAPGEERLISVNVTPPYSASVGKYSGKIIAVFNKVE